MRRKKALPCNRRQLLNVGVMELEIHDLTTTIGTIQARNSIRQLPQVGPGGMRNEILHCFKAPPQKTFVKCSERGSITLNGETYRHQGSKLTPIITGKTCTYHPMGFHEKNATFMIFWLKYICCAVDQSCPTLWDPMDCSPPGFPICHCLSGFPQTHAHWISDATQPSYPLWV